VTTTSGQIYTGVIARKTAQALVLREASGAEKLIPSKSIDSIIPQKTSLMPSGLPAAMTADEFRDLLAYLQALK
jgi:putative heme-binding domain-containing protein